jgi:hypothetical protein
VARESGGFDALLQTLDDAAGAGASQVAQPLRERLQRLRQSFDAVALALKSDSPSVGVADAQSAEYQAFAQSLREMALLEASMQTVAESGQQVLHRLAKQQPALSLA